MRTPCALAVAEVAADRLRHERERHDDVVEAVAAEQVDHVLHARLADDRDHRLRLVRGERAQARPLPARHDDGLHRVSRKALRRYCAAAASASARPIQKRTSGQSVPSAVPITNDKACVQHPGREFPEEVDLELVAALADERIADDERAVADEDHDERRPRQAPVQPEQEDRHVDHQAVGQRVGELAEARLDVPAPREPAVDLVGDAGERENARRGPAPLAVGAHEKHGEHRDQREAEDGEGVRKLRERGGNCSCGHGIIVSGLRRRAGSLARWPTASRSPGS